MTAARRIELFAEVLDALTKSYGGVTLAEALAAVAKVYGVTITDVTVEVGVVDLRIAEEVAP